LTKKLRVVLHAHSVWSYDGRWELNDIARLFGRIGVDAVMMTEHDTGFAPERFAEYCAACANASTASCRLVPGIEYSDPTNSVHILTWGLPRFLGAGRAVEATLEDVRAAGGVAVFAHPARRDAWRLLSEDLVPLLHGIEIWNRKNDGLAPGHEAVRLQAETGLPPTVGVDFHRWRNLYPIDHLFVPPPEGVGSNPEQAVVAALRAGTLVPRAFGRPLVDATSRPRPGAFRIHRGLETARRALRNLLPKRPLGRH
jgi:predicted metal-dependent phosphoesterase TrpH